MTSDLHEKHPNTHDWLGNTWEHQQAQAHEEAEDWALFIRSIGTFALGVALTLLTLALIIGAYRL